MPSVKAQAAATLSERGSAQAIVWPPRAARPTAPVAALPRHRAQASAAAVPGRVAEFLERPFPAAPAAAPVRLVLPAASARSAEEAAAGVRPHGVAMALGVALVARNVVALPSVAGAVQHEAVPRPEEAAREVSALAEAQPAAAVGAEQHAAAGEPEAVAEPGAAAGLQPEAVVEAERDEAVRPRAAEPGAVGLPQVVPSVPPSASVCRPGRLRPRALPPALRPAARSARGRRSLLSAAPRWRWWQAAQVEV